MKKSSLVLTKSVLFLLVSLMVLCNVQAVPPNGEHAVSLQIFTVASGSDAMPAEESTQEVLLQAQYDAAQASFDAQDYEKALEAFEALGDFSDSPARAADSNRKWKAARYKEAMTFYKAEQYYDAIEIFKSLGSYDRSRSYVDTCTWRIMRIEYKQAKEMHAAGDYENAKRIFESLGNYEDCRERAKAADAMIKAQEQAAFEVTLYEKALVLKEEGDLIGARDTLIQAGDCKDALDQLYSVLELLALQGVYENAEGYYANKDYENAYDLFVALGDYEDSAQRASLCKETWQAAVYADATAVQEDEPSRAYILFLSLGEYEDSKTLADGLYAATTKLMLYNAANAFEREGNYALAKLGFEAIMPYVDSQSRMMALSQTIVQTQDFKQASYLRTVGEEERANAIFEALGDFNNSSEMVLPITPRFTTKQLRDDKTTPVSPVFTAPDGTKHRYQIYKGVHTWVEAKAFCEVLGGHLATLTTEEENKYVHTFMRDCGYFSAYFGLSDEKRVGDWIWVTGEPFEYSNWDSGEPSRSARERYGMYFYKHTKGTWNDSHFYEFAEVDPGCSYICEWDE